MSMQSYKADSVDLSKYRSLLGSGRADSSRDQSFSSFKLDGPSRQGRDHSGDFSDLNSIMESRRQGNNSELMKVNMYRIDSHRNFGKKHDTSEILATDRISDCYIGRDRRGDFIENQSGFRSRLASPGALENERGFNPKKYKPIWPSKNRLQEL